MRSNGASCFSIFTIQISFYLLVILLKLPFSLSFAFRLAIHGLILLSLPLNSFLFLCCLNTIVFFLHGIKNSPHFSYFFRDLGDSIPRKLIFNQRINIHSIEKEGAHRFLWRFRLV